EKEDFNKDGGTILFMPHESTKEIHVLVFDSEGEKAEMDRRFVVHLERHRVGIPVGKRPSVEVSIFADRNKDHAAKILQSIPFQGVLTLSTGFALFGNDLAIIYGDKESDWWVEIITILNIFMFGLEICLLIMSKKSKYLFSVGIIMDLLALFGLVALVPSLPIMELFGGGASVGVVARAGRAARVASRAGRTVKLPKLLAKFVEISVVLVQFANKSKDQPKEEDNEWTDCDSDDPDAEDYPEEPEPPARTSDERSRPRTFSSHVASIAKEQSNVVKGKSVEKIDDLSKSMENMAEGNTGRVGGILMELLTGKVVLMMLLVLVVNSVLIVEPLPTQKKLGLNYLQDHYLPDDGDNDAFTSMLSEYKRGNPAGTYYNKDEPLIFLKVEGTEFNEGLDTAQLNLVRPTEFSAETSCSYSYGKVVNDLAKSDCPTVAIFDMSEYFKSESRNSIYMTLCIVLIMSLGMGLMAMDFQSLLGDPMERLVLIVGIIRNTFFNFQKAVTEPGPGPRLRHSVARPVPGAVHLCAAVHDGVEQAFGIKMGHYRNMLIHTSAYMIENFDLLETLLDESSWQSIMNYNVPTLRNVFSIGILQTPGWMRPTVKRYMTLILDVAEVLEMYFLNLMAEMGLPMPKEGHNLTFGEASRVLEQYAIAMFLEQIHALAMAGSSQDNVVLDWLENRPTIKNVEQLKKYAQLFITTKLSQVFQENGMQMPESLKELRIDNDTLNIKQIHDQIERALEETMEAELFKRTGVQMDFTALRTVKKDMKQLAQVIEDRLLDEVRPLLAELKIKLPSDARLSMTQVSSMLKETMADNPEYSKHLSKDQLKLLEIMLKAQQWTSSADMLKDLLSASRYLNVQSLLKDYPVAGEMIDICIKAFNTADGKVCLPVIVDAAEMMFLRHMEGNLSTYDELVVGVAFDGVKYLVTPKADKPAKPKGRASFIKFVGSMLDTSMEGMLEVQDDTKATLNASDLMGVMTKTLNMVFGGEAVEKMRRKSSTVQGMLSLLPNPAMMQEMSDERLLHLLQRINYPKGFQGMLPGDLPSPEAVAAMSREDAADLLIELKNAAMGGATLQKMRSSISAAATLRAAVPDLAALQTMSSEEIQKLLDDIDFPGAFAHLSATFTDMKLPSREEALAMSREDLLAVLMQVKDKLVGGSALSRINAAASAKVLQAASAGSALMSVLRDCNAMPSMSDEQVKELLSKIDYPDSLQKLLPADTKLPSREEALAMSREDLLAVLMQVKDKLVGGSALSRINEAASAKVLQAASAGSALMSVLRDCNAIPSMSDEQVKELLSKIGYPDSLQKLLPADTKLPSREEALAMSREDLLAVLMQVKDKLVGESALSRINEAASGKVLQAASAGSALMSVLRDCNAMPSMSDEQVKELLSKIDYPDSLQKLLPADTKLPSREEALAMSREDLLAVLMQAKDKLVGGSALSRINEAASGNVLQAASAGSALMSVLRDCNAMPSMSDEQVKELLSKIDYPDSLQKLLPADTKLPSREEALAMSREDLLAVLTKVKVTLMEMASKVAERGAGQLERVKRLSSVTPDFSVIKGMSDEQLRKLLEGINYPDAFGQGVAEITEMPSREEALAMPREDLVTKIADLREAGLRVMLARAQAPSVPATASPQLPTSRGESAVPDQPLVGADVKLKLSGTDVSPVLLDITQPTPGLASSNVDFSLLSTLSLAKIQVMREGAAKALNPHADPHRQLWLREVLALSPSTRRSLEEKSGSSNRASNAALSVMQGIVTRIPSNKALKEMSDGTLYHMVSLLSELCENILGDDGQPIMPDASGIHMLSRSKQVEAMASLSHCVFCSAPEECHGPETSIMDDPKVIPLPILPEDIDLMLSLAAYP
ncbi:hypothetical protein CYMTET_34577, partial [Cymbomonas tetramitiformis]